MIITLNNTLTISNHEYAAKGIDKESLVQKLQFSKLKDSYKSKKYDYIGSTFSDDASFQLGVLAAISKGYSSHVAVEINPHDFWMIVLCELNTIVEKNVEKCRPLFTKSKEKIEILIPAGSAEVLDLSFLVNELKTLIPLDTSLFIPELSTLDDSSRACMYAALADCVQHYYSYSTFCCGIPAIHLNGTKEDWNTLLQNVYQLAATFLEINVPEAVEYLVKVGDIFDNIYKCFDPNFDSASFFENIFTQRNVGSGGELDITGWITDLYVKDNRGKRIDNFYTTICKVPYKNLTTGREFVQMHGAFERTFANDVYQSKYGHFIFEKLKNE